MAIKLFTLATSYESDKIFELIKIKNWKIEKDWFLIFWDMNNIHFLKGKKWKMIEKIID